jgi:hypothetical protein
VAYAILRAASRLISTQGCRYDCRHGRLKPTLRPRKAFRLGPERAPQSAKDCVTLSRTGTRTPECGSPGTGLTAAAHFINCASLSFTAAPQMSYPLATGCRLSGMKASGRKTPFSSRNLAPMSR